MQLRDLPRDISSHPSRFSRELKAEDSQKRSREEKSRRLSVSARYRVRDKSGGAANSRQLDATNPNKSAPLFFDDERILFSRYIRSRPAIAQKPSESKDESSHGTIVFHLGI